MKITVNSTSIRAGIACILSVSFVLFPTLRISAAKTTDVSVNARTESDVRSEASRYDNAIKAIAGVASLKLENQDDLKKALAILDREGPNLRFIGSKLIVLGLNDSTLSASVKKASPNEAAAEALIKEASADPKAVLKLNGAQSLVARLQQSAQTDAATLRSIAERLNEAAAKIKKSSRTTVKPDFGRVKLIPVVYAGEVPEPSINVIPPQAEIIGVCLVVVAAVIFIQLASPILKTIGQFLADALTKVIDDIEKQTADCRGTADRRRTNCVNEANQQPFPLNLAAQAACDAEWLKATAECLLPF